MHKIIKCAIRNILEINYINTLPADGVEIQLFKDDNDFSLLDKIELPIINFHYDLDYTNKDYSDCDIVGMMERDFDNGHFDDVLKHADKYHANVLLHMARNPLNEQNLTKFMDKIRNFSGKILLENVGDKNAVDPHDFTGICDALNFLYGENKFMPILDICHFYKQYSDDIDGLPSIKEVIKCNRINGNLYFHFNYGVGDCTGDNHSCTFETNVPLMVNLITYIKSLDKDASLILEVYEKSYTDYQNALWMINKINEIENTSPAKESSISKHIKNWVRR